MNKVSILTYSLGSGGAERVISTLLVELSKYYQIELFLMSNIIHYEIPKEINITYLEQSNINENGFQKLLKLPWLAFKYKKLCRDKNIDISLSFLSRPNYINSLAKVMGNNVKTIIFERAMPSLEYAKTDIKSFINKFLIKNLFTKADLIVANSQANRLDLIENFDIKKEIKVIHNPINIEMINMKKLEKVDFVFDRYTYITIGRLDTGKNHQMMIDAFNELSNEETQLIIIGYGPLEEALKEYIRELNLENRVYLVGRQSNPYKWLYNANCFLFTSRHEGFPNVILEAMVCGLPIVSTNPRDVVNEILGHEGNYIETVEQMHKKLETPLKRINYNKKLVQFHIEKILPKYLKILQ